LKGDAALEKEKITRATRLSYLIMFLSALLIISGSLNAQEIKPIYDARLSLKPATPSGEIEQIFNNEIIPEAKAYWSENSDKKIANDSEKPVIIDIANGAFTRPGAIQKAVLYRYCSKGHNFGLNGIAILEDMKLKANVFYEGGWDNAIGSLPDINQNGIAEIIIATAGTNQGQNWKYITVLEIKDTEARSFGSIIVYTDDYGISEKNGKAEASKISVKAGSVPVFYKDTFTGKSSGGKWKKTEQQKQITPKADKTEYIVIKKSE